MTQALTLNAQEIQYFGINEYGGRSIGMGLTGIVDAYGPLSVLRNPALNRTGKRVTIKPFFEWIGNGKWDEVTLIPQQLNGTLESVAPADLSNDTGMTSRYLGGVIQGRGITFGYIHSNRDELLFIRDLGIFDPTSVFYGRHVESDFLFAGYNFKIGRKGRIGFLLKNYQFLDTDTLKAAASTIRNRDDIDRFLNEKGLSKETTVGIDIGGLMAVSILKRPVTFGISLINIVSSDFAEKTVPFYLSAGIAVVPIRNLLLEINAVDITDEDGKFSTTGIRAGIEYTLRGLRVRSGSYGENISFGLGVGGEGLNLDYGVIEIDHIDVKGRKNKERFQSLQVSLSGNFY